MKNTKRKLAISLLVIATSISHVNPASAWSNAQTTVSVFGGSSGGDLGRSIAVDSGGNIYTTGHFRGTVDFDPGTGTSNLTSVGFADVFVSKLNSTGDLLWAKGFGGTSGGDFGHSIAVDSGGNIYTTGHFRGTVDFDPGAGTSNLTSAGATDVFVSKLDSAGDLIWAKSFGGGVGNLAYSIAVDGSGNIYTTGYFRGTADFDPGEGTFNLTNAGSGDAFVSKLNSAGDFLWAKRFGGTQSDRAYSIAVDSSGNVYTTGYFQATVDFDPGAGTSNLTSAGATDAFVSKLDSAGDFLWAKRFGGTQSERAYSIAVDGSGNVYTTGYFSGTVDFDPGAGTSNLTSVGQGDAFVSKLDSAGDLIWAKSFGGTESDLGLSIAVDGSGNVYTTGYFRRTVDFDPGAGTSNLTSVGSDDVFVSKLDSTGNLLWAKSFGGTSFDFPFEDDFNSIAVDGSGNVYTTGYFQGTVDFDPGEGTSNLTSAGYTDVFVLKLTSSGDVTISNAAEAARYAAEAARYAAEAAKKAKEQKELTELLSVIPSIAGLALNIGDLTNSLLTTKCVKGKTIKNVKKGAKCPKGYVKKK
ncbi:MAG: SBBP repeat-containing protein [Candidatus Planktophila sp.]